MFRSPTCKFTSQDCWNADQDLSWYFGPGAVSVLGKKGWCVGRGGGSTGVFQSWLASEFRQILQSRKGGAAWKDGSQRILFVLSFSQGKTCSPLVVFAYLTGGVNSLVLVTQLVLWTAVPGCVRTNYKLMWVVKYGFPNFLFFLRNKSLFKCKVWCGSFLINTVFFLLGQLLSAEKICTGGLTSKTQKAVLS